MSDIEVRAAATPDQPDIVAIYNHYVQSSHVTFDTRALDVTARADWFRQFVGAGRHRLLVAARDGRVLGWASSTRLRPRPAYDTSVETTVYVSSDATGEGIGHRLYRVLLDLLPCAGAHRAYAGIGLPNPASVALHEHHGFRHVGTFAEVGYKFDRYWDVAWYERPL